MASKSHESYYRYERSSKSSRSSRSTGKRQLPKTSSEHSAKTTTRESTASYISSSQTGGEAYTPETGSKQYSQQTWSSRSLQHQSTHNTISKDLSVAERLQQDYPDYAENIIAGTASLGIEATPYLQQVLVQRYGELWMSGSYTYGDDNPGGCENGFVPVPVDVQDTVRYDDEDWAYDGYLVGVGAQFERS